MDKNNRLTLTIIAVAFVGCAFVGLLSLILAIFPLFQGDFITAGLLLLASGVSFGLLLSGVIGR